MSATVCEPLSSVYAFFNHLEKALEQTTDEPVTAALLSQDFDALKTKWTEDSIAYVQPVSTTHIDLDSIAYVQPVSTTHIDLDAIAYVQPVSTTHIDLDSAL
jgi:limonene-1,2-epoxide hydrolase